MNYIREAENVLCYYRDLYRSIERMDKEIARLVRMAGPHDISAIVTDKELGNGKHDETINILFQIQQLTENRSKTERELKKVDEILADISCQAGCENYGLVLTKWYIEGQPKHEIAKELGYTERHLYRIKGSAIRKFAVRLFGIEVLKVV